MKKVLIISYFYPPANFVGAQRTASWAKYLKEFGYYPIIITRQWNDGQTDLVDKVKNNGLSIEIFETHEVHRLPYVRTLRDHCSDYPWLKPLQKLFTLKELLLSNFFISAIPYANFYKYAKNLLKKDDTISIVIASGRPFQSFFIGHQLKKDFPSIHWIPDYRDEWTTHQTPHSLSYAHRLMSPFEKNSELKWTKNAALFISVTPKWTDNIASSLKIVGKTIFNGFDILSLPYITEKNGGSSLFELSYLGTAYPSQDFKTIILSVLQIAKENQTKFKINFFGAIPFGSKEVELWEKESGGKISFEFFEKKEKKDLIESVKSTDIFFLTSLKNNDGWLPVKLFDYYNSDKPILLCPSDKDLMEKFIKKTNSGYVANSIEECKTILHKLIMLKEGGKPLIGPRNNENAIFYSRKHQTKRLARYLDKLSQ